MTQKDKQLLLQDLCARSPYGVKLKIGDYSDYKLIGIVITDESPIKIEVVEKNEVYKIEVIPDLVEPYLRPMSSMTEDEKDEMFGICTLSNCSINSNWECVGVEVMSSHPRYGDHYSTDYKVIDWLNKNMFDYRGLIPKGLALEAPDGMYNQNYKKMPYKYFPDEFSSYEDYVKYLKEKGFAIEVIESNNPYKE